MDNERPPQRNADILGDLKKVSGRGRLHREEDGSRRLYRVGVVDPTTLLGQETLKLLNQRNFPFSEVQLFSSVASDLRRIIINEEGEREEVMIHNVSPRSFEGMDIVFFAGTRDLSTRYAHRAVEAGALVLDLSGGYRNKPGVPMVIPEVNFEEAKAALSGGRIIANPTDLTILLLTALYPLHLSAKLKRVIVDTYQSVSDGGREAVEELSSQTRRILQGQAVIPHAMPHQIAYNVLPETEVFRDNGYSVQENNVMAEVRRLIREPKLQVSLTTVRVPVLIGHSMSVHAEFSNLIGPEVAREILSRAPGVVVRDDPTVSMYPQPWQVAGQDPVYVGRIREDASLNTPVGIAFWLSADNLRKGAALNAMQVVEALIGLGMM